MRGRPPLTLAPYALVAIVFMIELGWRDPDPIVAALASVVMAGVVMWAFLMANPALVGPELALLTLATVARSAPPTRLEAIWLGSAGLAGATGAWLCKRRAREDDYFFIMPGTAAVAFGAMAWAGEGFHAGKLLEMAAAWIGTLQAAITAQIKANPDWPRLREMAGEDFLNALPWFYAIASPGAWAWGLWIVSRMARRWSGRMDPRRASFLLFRVEHRYIFLLICACVSWIVGILIGREKVALCVAGPVLAAFAVACLVDGLAIVLFHLALWRAMLEPLAWRLRAMALLVVFLLLGGVALALCAAIGLLDVWFDFRHVKAMEERLEAERPNDEERP
jgi:hypothetical protein